MIQVGIIGAAGYTAGELIRILLHHPQAEILFAQSTSHAGEPVAQAHPDLVGETSLCFVADADVSGANVIFLCMGHGKSRAFVDRLSAGFQGKIIDLSHDYRLSATANGFVYGLPEAFRSAIQQAHCVANPGCFATAIQLALLPAAKANWLGEVHVHAVTGSTGAGQAPSETTHFSWRDNNMSVYKAFSHQHLDEINETLHQLSPGYQGALNFIPIRGNYSRGIMASVYFNCPASEAEVQQVYQHYYAQAPFVHLVSHNPDLKMVVNTNKAVLFVRKYGSKVHVVSLIDNLTKGASGQAVHNMNLMFGLDEQAGLHLKPSAF